MLVFQEDDARFWTGLGSSRDDRFLIIASGSKLTTEIRLLDAATPLEPPRVVAPRREGVEYDVEPAGDRLLITHNADNPDFDIAQAPLDATGPEQWTPFVASQPGERIVDVEAFAGHVVVSLRREGLTALRVLPRDCLPGRLRTRPRDHLRRAALLGGHGQQPRVRRDGAAGGVRVARDPAHHLRLRRGDRRAAPCSSGSRSSAATTRRRTSSDVSGPPRPTGRRCRSRWSTAAGPSRTAPRPGCSTATAPTRSPTTPTSPWPGSPCSTAASSTRWPTSAAAARWAAAGTTTARWTRKVNTFTDFIACADHLVETGWVAPDRLVAEGGSAGGLLIGAVVNMAPDRFRAVHAAVPFVDALTTILDPSLPLTVPEWEEWGNPLRRPRGLPLHALLHAVRERHARASTPRSSRRPA